MFRQPVRDSWSVVGVGGGLAIGVPSLIYGVIYTVEFIEAVIRLIHRF